MAFVLKFLRRCLALFLVLSFGLAVFIYFAVLETEPGLPESGPATPTDVATARQLLHAVRASAATDPALRSPLVVSEEVLNRVARVTSQLVPGARGQVQIDPDSLFAQAALPIPFTDQSRWLNLRIRVPEYSDGIRVQNIQIGKVNLPPTLTVEAGRIGANIFIGNGVGDTVFNATENMQIDADTVTFALKIGEVGKNGVMRGVFGALRGNEMPSADEINQYYIRIREAMEDGHLPSQGSYLPYLIFTLNAAYAKHQTEGAHNAYTAALFALTRICGARDFTMIVGRLAGNEPEEIQNWSQNCNNLTLNGRIDTRRHFTTAAALQAASNRGFSTKIGEFKELYDTIKSGGFDFTDIAANNSGIRLSDTFMLSNPDKWPELISKIETEQDVMIAFDGIPQILSEEDFNARFRSVDSPQYMDMLAVIEAKIDNLRIHQMR